MILKKRPVRSIGILMLSSLISVWVCPTSFASKPKQSTPIIRFSGKPMGTPVKSNNPGGSRGSCPKGDPQMLVHADSRNNLTLSDRPTFWVHFPYRVADVIPDLNERTNEVRREKMRIRWVVNELSSSDDAFYDSGKLMMQELSPGFISFSLPPGKSLEMGKSYEWSVKIYCDGSDSVPESVSGTVTRITPSNSVITQLKKSPSDLDRLQLYAKEGLWYETVDNMIRLRSNMSQDQQMQDNWKAILEQSSTKNVDQDKIQDIISLPAPE
jgi:Domain of Unknown Function (DUF928)